MNERMKRFIEKQTCATVCCIDEEGKPYCFNVFYSFESSEVLLCFKSSGETKHFPLLTMNPNVAGTILPDKLSLLTIKGIQFQGLAFMADESNQTAAIAYYTRHPLARAVPGDIWTITINEIKFTDNSLGFGSKDKWSRTLSKNEINQT